MDKIARLKTEWKRVLPIIESALAPFQPRPHWGKLFTMAPSAVRDSYESLLAFADLLRRHDSAGTFRNGFLERYL